MQVLSLVGLLLLLPGYFSDLNGPKIVYAVRGRSVPIQCRYNERYNGNPKYWCREMNSRTCNKIAQTLGSEEPVRKERTSIRDNHSLHQFTVTIDELTDGDIGIYKCGVIVKGGSDLTVPVNVTATTRKPDNSEQNRDAFSRLDYSSISYLIYVSFLVSIGLKPFIFLCVVLAIIWMHKRTR
ncbi:CMRF35-like molecule 5 [Rhineura floridana]|uniref:CMRF35-like molecule 5 n=1 Tax=Rhineura floridana TaxID=261503 RepID=UPI002AC86108|nr:CMRF35-like molecule 5 [Rhineura floridana]